MELDSEYKPKKISSKRERRLMSLSSWWNAD